VRWQFVSWHAAQRLGTPAGQQLYAVGEALRALGHEVDAWSWRESRPDGDVASWCEWRPLPPEPSWRTRARALVHPRSDVVRAQWRPAADGIAIADDPISWAAVASHAGLRVATVHYSVTLDRRALNDRSPARLQDRRGERSAVRGADQSWALSERVATDVGCDVVVPATIPFPDSRVDLVDEPIVGMLADWNWPPNRHAADVLLRAWPSVRERVAGAKLLLAGRGAAPVGTVPGVEFLGVVPTATDLLARLALFAFPCPATSGPKMKVLEALGHGVPVVTSAYGVEAITGAEAGAAVATTDTFVETLVQLLRDPQRRAAMARGGREAVLAAHAPDIAARARIAAVVRSREA
jgi:glycosyltransferase involved in cell wall biosynthesis